MALYESRMTNRSISTGFLPPQPPGTLLAAAALVARPARPAPAAPPLPLPGELMDGQGEAKQEMTEPNGYIYIYSWYISGWWCIYIYIWIAMVYIYIYG